ncbi:MAG: hypothetical protein KAW16_06210 [candidate division Zixibacteria bacterium]|nr:hypothetical protein [candidate division Zixibacteria bacterium]
MLISRHRIREKIYLLFFISSLVVLWFGCFNPFSPSVVGPSAIKPIARQTDPDSVLHNFKYAYENRDSIVYENCLDKDFIFKYTEQDEIEGEIEVEIPRDGKGGDIYVTKALFRAFDDIRLDTWIVIPAPDSVGEGIWKKRNVTFHLSLRDTDGDYNFQHLEATGFAEFMFRQSEKDNLWRIVRWIDKSMLD